MKTYQVIAVHVLIGLLLIATVLLQVFGIPELAQSSADQLPEAGHLVTPYTIIAIAALVCVEVILVGIGVLVYQSRPGRSPSRITLTWLTVMRYAALVAGILSIGISFHLVLIEDLGGPSYMFAALAGIGFFLAALTMRAVSTLMATTREYAIELAEVV